MQKSDFSISAFKQAGGEETMRFECQLLYQGLPIAHVSNSGRGGCHHWHKNPKVNSKLWETFKSFCIEAFPDSGFEQEDHLIDSLIEEIEEKKWLERNSKKSTCFRLIGDKKGEWRKVNALGDKAKEWLKGKYGDAIETIYQSASQPKAPAAPKAPPSPESKALMDGLSAAIKKHLERLSYLKSRWLDEREYEDFAEYEKVIREIFEGEGFKVLKIGKSFSIDLAREGRKLNVKIGARSITSGIYGAA